MTRLYYRLFFLLFRVKKGNLLFPSVIILILFSNSRRFWRERKDLIIHSAWVSFSLFLNPYERGTRETDRLSILSSRSILTGTEKKFGKRDDELDHQRVSSHTMEFTVSVFRVIKRPPWSSRRIPSCEKMSVKLSSILMIFLFFSVYLCIFFSWSLCILLPVLSRVCLESPVCYRQKREEKKSVPVIQFSCSCFLKDDKRFLLNERLWHYYSVNSCCLHSLQTLISSDSSSDPCKSWVRK